MAAANRSPHAIAAWERPQIWDYILKNGFQKIAIGLSGGVDSAMTVAIAADALGPENVTGVLMPSPYTSDASGAESLALAKNLNIQRILHKHLNQVKGK